MITNQLNNKGKEVELLSISPENINKIFNECKREAYSNIHKINELENQNKKLLKLYNQSLNDIKILQEVLEGKL